MKAITVVLVVAWLSAIPAARADSLTEAVQQRLKDEGFYYGEVTGKKDADTTAAIRRYQIRNGLQINGEINAETQKSLGIKGNAPAPRSTPPAPPNVPPRTAPDVPEDEAPGDQRVEPPSPPGYPAKPYGSIPEISTLFAHTPYENSPPEVQRRVILGAQSLLAHQGYYRGAIDGLFGPDTEFALHAYQSRFGIEPSGRFDRQTLATLGLLPGQRAPGVTAPRRSIFRWPWPFAPRGERIYTPPPVPESR